MKRTLSALIAIFILTTSQVNAPKVNNDIAVILPLSGWQNTIYFMKNSTAPANEVGPLIETIAQQVNNQLDAKQKAAADTTKNKKP